MHSSSPFSPSVSPSSGDSRWQRLPFRSDGSWYHQLHLLPLLAQSVAASRLTRGSSRFTCPARYLWASIIYAALDTGKSMSVCEYGRALRSNWDTLVCSSWSSTIKRRMLSVVSFVVGFEVDCVALFDGFSCLSKQVNWWADSQPDKSLKRFKEPVNYQNKDNPLWIVYRTINTGVNRNGALVKALVTVAGWWSQPDTMVVNVDSSVPILL